MAAALNVALTRTAVASTLILSFLSGEQCAVPSILAASLMSLFVTAYMPFIHTQHSRSDLEDAIFYEFQIDEDCSLVEAVGDLDPSRDLTDCTVTTVDSLTPMHEISKSATTSEPEHTTVDSASPLVSSLV
jgi:hypothetical protein